MSENYKQQLLQIKKNFLNLLRVRGFKKNKVIIILLFIVASFFVYRHFFQTPAQIPQDIKVIEVEKASISNITKSIRLIGTIRANNTSILIAQDSGVLDIIVASGKKLVKGELIARIVNIEVQKRYELSMQAENIAKEQLKRAQNLLNSGAYSKGEFEKYKNAWISASKDASGSKIDLDRLQFYAAFDGIVGSYKYQSGAQLKTGEAIVSFYDPSKIRVEFDVPISAVSYVNDGQDISILNKNYKLTHIQKMLDEDKHMSPAYCEISCMDCIIGSNVDVELVLEKKDSNIVIPFEAVFLRDGVTSVYVIKDAKAAIRNVNLGIRNKNLVEVINGLTVGEEFVSSNPTRLYPDVTVKIK